MKARIWKTAGSGVGREAGSSTLVQRALSLVPERACGSYALKRVKTECKIAPQLESFCFGSPERLEYQRDRLVRQNGGNGAYGLECKTDQAILRAFSVGEGL